MLSMVGNASAGLGPGLACAPTATDLLYAFDRPAEPVFTPRGLHRDVAFDVPASYLPEHYVKRASEVRAAAQRAGMRLIAVPELDMPAERFADVDAVQPFRGQYTRAGAFFFAFAVRFWHFFNEGSTVGEVLARVVWARLHFNPEMVLDALMLYMMRSPIASVKDVHLPELPQYFPEFFVDAEFFPKSREEMHLISEANRVPVPVLRNLSRDDEAVLWYFREDPLLHVFHWKWHVHYPAADDDDQYIDGPRRGELFVHMHRQFIARYNAERFANGLPTVLPMDVHKPVEKGYFPKMLHLHGGKGMIGRQANTSLLPLTSFIEDHDRWVKRYEEVLKEGYVDFVNGSRVKLNGIKGLDIVSNLLEANVLLTPNLKYYGSVHNWLHGNLAIAADPLGSYNEPFSIDSHVVTVGRDPAFYNIHMLMDNLYEKYKRKKLTPYSEEELTPLPGVTVQSVGVLAQGALGARVQPNHLSTYWQQTDLDVALGLDFTPPGRQYARFTHLQHRPFHYHLQVLNSETEDRKVFVRLFLLMVQDENNMALDLDFRRRFSIQMDTFETVLRPGVNTVQRASTDSALTIDNDAVFKEYPEHGDDARVRRQNVCRCGWPQGLLLPRGTANGTQYNLLAMVTDYEQDRAPASDAETCRDGWLICGVPGSAHYPDVRAMGFPLDRPFRDGVRTLDDFLTRNMAVADVRVVSEDATQPPTAMLPGARSTSWMPSVH